MRRMVRVVGLEEDTSRYVCMLVKSLSVRVATLPRHGLCNKNPSPMPESLFADKNERRQQTYELRRVGA